MKVIKWLLGGLVSRQVMPAQNRKDDYEDVRAQTQKGVVSIQQKMIDSTGGARINVSEFTNTQNQEGQRKRVLIFSVGNGDGYERNFEFYVKMARIFPSFKVAAFNFRNVYASKGKVTSEQDWIDDAKSVVLHYRDQGFKNKHILVCGHSLGGAIATMMAAQLYEEDIKRTDRIGEKKADSIKIINNRSLANLVDVVMIGLLGKGVCSIFNCIFYGGLAGLGMVVLGMPSMWAFGAGLGLGFMTGLYSWVHPKVCFDILRPWMDVAAMLCFGRIDAYQAYQKLPNKNKDYLVAKDESVTTKYASLHYHLKHVREKKQRSLAKKISELEKIVHHQDLPLDEAQAQRLQKLKDELMNSKDSKLRHKYIDDGLMSHNDSLCQLMTYHQMRKQDEQQINGQTVLTNKINRLFKCH